MYCIIFVWLSFGLWLMRSAVRIENIKTVFVFVWASLDVQLSGKLTLKKVPKMAKFRQKVKGLVCINLKINTLFFPQVLLAKWISTAEIICNLNQYTFRVSDSNTRCVNCPRCPAGFGTVPPCGAFLDHMVNVVCGVCVSGRTFSSSHDTTSCEPCTVCVDNEIAIKKCTRTSNTVCGKCKPG